MAEERLTYDVRRTTNNEMTLNSITLNGSSFEIRENLSHTCASDELARVPKTNFDRLIKDDGFHRIQNIIFFFQFIFKTFQFACLCVSVDSTTLNFLIYFVLRRRCSVTRKVSRFWSREYINCRLSRTRTDAS